MDTNPEHGPKLCNISWNIWTDCAAFLLYFKARFGDLDLLGPKYKWVIGNNGELFPDALLGLLKEGDNIAIVGKRKEMQEEIIVKVGLNYNTNANLL